jgi:type I restriction-modification system DNA methylase subunit
MNKTIESIMESTINYIRDVLRKEGITGMDSINHCIVFVLCRMLDEDTCKKTKIDTKYAYENIMIDENGDEIGDQELYGKIFVKGKDCLITEFINKLQFRNIKFKLEGIQNLKGIMKKMKKFNPKELSNVYDIIGTIYEIHLKSGTSNAMRDLGQYYTHRLIINYMIKLCDPKMEKGIVEKIVDPTMGTGGFLTMAIKYLNEKYKNKIDWSKNKSNIIGFDIDENVRNMALLNVFLETGELMSETICKQDTLHNDLKFLDGTILNKAKVILANEPMGLKNIVLSSCCDRIKNGLKAGTKAEPLFLHLFMEALDDEGRCAVIVPDGMLFNDSSLHNEIRKQLVENFNLKKVVGLSDDFFLNTGVKTSILYFTKDGKKTEDVDFSSIKLKNNEIEETSIIKVKYNELKTNKFSLFVNKYNVQAIEKVQGVEYKKLGDVCKITFGKRIKKDDVSVDEDYNGEKYPCYGGGDISFYMKEYNREGTNLLISRFGLSEKCVRLTKGKLWLNDSGFTLLSNDSKLMQEYLNYYILIMKQKTIYDLSTGSCQKNINIDEFNNIEIPIPSLSIQKQIVESLDLLSENIATSKKQIEETKEILKNYMIIKTKNIIKEKSCDDLFDMTIGKKTSSSISEDGAYDFYNGSAKAPIGKAVDYSCDNKTPYILIIKDGGAGQGNYGEQIGLGKTFYVSGKTSFTTSVVALINNDEKKMDTKYLYYYLHSQKNNLMDLAQYTTGLGHMGTTKLKNFMIKTPSFEQQKEISLCCDKYNDIINNTEIQIENNKDLMKQILNEYLKNNDDIKKESESEISSSESEKEDKKSKNIKEKKIIKKVSKKEKDDTDSESDSSSENEKPVKKDSKKKK